MLHLDIQPSIPSKPLSMAEAVAVLGLVSAIVQLVDFSSKVIHRLHEFTSATTDVPDSFQSIKVQLPLFVTTLQRVQAQADAGHISDVAAQVALRMCRH
jgi:hypothetical protein